MGHQNIFSINKNPSLYEQLKTSIVMVGLNFSRPLLPTEPFKNFHDLSPYANDFKIRYAFHDTEYYGAYMTDIIKKYEMKDSHNVMTHINSNPNIIKENILLFQKELIEVQANRPIILAFGRDSYMLLKQYLTKDQYKYLIKLTHYSHQISKEDYKDKIYKEIKEGMK